MNLPQFQRNNDWLKLTCAAIGGFSLVSMFILLPSVRVSANPATPTSAQSVTPTQSDTTIQKQILGQWLTKEPLAGDMVMFVFAANGKAFLISGESPDGRALARPIQYRIDATPSPMFLDLILSPTATVETVFELTAANDLRIQMLETYPGKPRPSALAPNATTFQKISDSTDLPPNTALMQLKPQVAP